MTPTMTAKLATAPASAVGTPGRRRISRSGAGASVCCANVAYAFESSFGSCLIPSETSRPANAKSDDPSQGHASSFGVSARFANTGPKTSGPKIAPETAAKRTNDIPRARRSGANISAAAARGVPDVRAAERLVRDAPDRDHAPPGRELARERDAGGDLAARRSAIRMRLARVRRHRVPEEHVVLEAELRQHAVDHGGGRLRRALAGQLALGGERDPRHARPTVPWRLGNHQHARGGALVEVALEPTAQEHRPSADAVEVVRRADLGRGQPLDEPSRHDPYSDRRRPDRRRRRHADRRLPRRSQADPRA